MAKLITADGRILITIGDIVGDTSIDGDLTVVNMTATGGMYVGAVATTGGQCVITGGGSSTLRLTNGGQTVTLNVSNDAASLFTPFSVKASETYFSNRVAIFGTSFDGSEKLNVNGAGYFADKITTNSDSIQVNTAKTPASAGATGTTGQIAWDSGYIYVCTATDTWKRSAITTW